MTKRKKTEPVRKGKKTEPLETIVIQEMPGMNPTQLRKCGLDQLSDEELANLNEFLNRPRSRELLAPGPISH